VRANGAKVRLGAHQPGEPLKDKQKKKKRIIPGTGKKKVGFDGRQAVRKERGGRASQSVSAEIRDEPAKKCFCVQPAGRGKFDLPVGERAEGAEGDGQAPKLKKKELAPDRNSGAGRGRKAYNRGKNIDMVLQPEGGGKVSGKNSRDLLKGRHGRRGNLGNPALSLRGRKGGGVNALRDKEGPDVSKEPRNAQSGKEKEKKHSQPPPEGEKNY